MSANSITANVLYVDYVPTVNKHLSIVYCLLNIWAFWGLWSLFNPLSSLLFYYKEYSNPIGLQLGHKLVYGLCLQFMAFVYSLWPSYDVMTSLEA